MRGTFYWLATFLVISTAARSQQTRFEKSAGKETATYFEAVQWYKDLAKSSPLIKVKEMGMTDAGYPLHLVMVSTGKDFDPEKWHLQNKLVIFINNGIHPGEPDGIDASMMLARDIIKGKQPLPSNVVLAIIPVYNIGGCLNRNSYTRVNQNGPVEYGFRGNSQNLDLNRDFTKCDTREAKSFSQIFHWLNPDVQIDNHVSDGADYQHTMTLITTQYDKLDPQLGDWVRTRFEPAIYQLMKNKSWELIPYVDFDNTDFNKGMRMFYDPPRYSSGYAALFQTISFMPETHMLKPYDQRVRSTYDLMKSIIEVGATHSHELITKRRAAQLAIKTQAIFPLRWTPDSSKLRQVSFKGYERDTSISNATELKKMFYNHNKPYNIQIPYFDHYKPAQEVTKPLAYVIPHGWQDVIDRLQLNNVRMRPFAQDTFITVTAYRIEDLRSLPVAYEKHHRNSGVKISSTQKSIKFLKGDYFIPLDQASNRYLVEMLEPTGDDSFFAWNFFDGILQQKEGYSDYRWEDLAAGVLEKSPELRQKLEEKKTADPKFAASAPAILDYIYRNSPYYEKSHLQYPVYRIENQ